MCVCGRCGCRKEWASALALVFDGRQNEGRVVASHRIASLWQTPTNATAIATRRPPPHLPPTQTGGAVEDGGAKSGLLNGHISMRALCECDARTEQNQQYRTKKIIQKLLCSQLHCWKFQPGRRRSNNAGEIGVQLCVLHARVRSDEPRVTRQHQQRTSSGRLACVR